MKMTKEQKSFLIDFLNETGFEIWNASCNLRLSTQFAIKKDVGIATHDDPLHPIKEYFDIQKAINFMLEDDY